MKLEIMYKISNKLVTSFGDFVTFTTMIWVKRSTLGTPGLSNSLNRL